MPLRKRIASEIASPAPSCGEGRRRCLQALIGLPLLLVYGCAAPAPRSSRPPATPPARDPIAELVTTYAVTRMGYATQVGAFSQLDNAVRLERRLQAAGVDAYYFRHESGLYKVRFGDHPTYDASRLEARRLQTQGVIESFFTILPGDYTAAKVEHSGAAGRSGLRRELVQTAERFLGVPYRWGGTDQAKGFDCSGLTLVTYRLNGLNLPRVSRQQYTAGRPIKRSQLQPGDLVFFATKGGSRITHVGLYVDSDRFIHAPRTGKTVRYARLSNGFWQRTYRGARTYL